MNLVIVESPAKAKTINKYLGSDYTVLASYGHIRDLPSKNGSVDPENSFKMIWEIDSFSKKYLKEITDAAKDSSKIILATDPDREGEAIAWHVKEYLDVWSLIDKVWHLKPLKFEYMNIWKSNQEKEMFLQKGNALQDEKLSSFLRMLNVSIPHKSFDFINSYALLLIDQERNLIEAGLNL